MKQFITILFCLASTYSGYAQSLGNYPASSAKAGENIIVNCSSTPSGVSRMTVTGPPVFSGVLTGNPSNGKIYITNAKPVGEHTIKVRAFNSSGSSTTRYFTLSVRKPDCSRASYHDTTLMTNFGPNLVHMASGDWNRDGIQDLAMVNQGRDAVSIRLGNGDGTFYGNTEVGVTNHPHAIAIGDFNRDGKQDFVVTNQGNSLVAVRLGDGLGGFGSMPNVSVGNGCIGIVAGDFNEDGKPDFITANVNSHTLSVRLGDGLGNFSSASSVPVDSFPNALAIGDFNTDDHLDLVVACGKGTACIRFGNGNGTFTNGPSVPAGFSPNSVAVGDFNNDGDNDLAIANFSSNTVSVRMGSGIGTFSGSVEVPVGNNPYTVVIGNFNGDDFADLATTNSFGNTVSIRLGDGQGRFGGFKEVPVGSYPINIAVGDFNGDHRQDFAVTNDHDNSVSVLLADYPLPPLNFIVSNSPVCQGQTINITQLYPAIGNRYTWSGPGGFFAPYPDIVIPQADTTNEGVYTVIVSDRNNCSSTSSVTVNLLPQPNVSVALSFDTICYGSQIYTLSGGSPSDGTWSGPGVMNGNQFSPDLTGTGMFIITYTYDAPNGCRDTANARITVLNCVGIDEVENDFRIYPNPFSDKIMIDMPQSDSKSAAWLFSMDGKLLGEYAIRQGRNMLPVEHLSPGMYWIKIVNADSVRTFSVCRQGIAD